MKFAVAPRMVILVALASFGLALAQAGETHAGKKARAARAAARAKKKMMERDRKPATSGSLPRPSYDYAPELAPTTRRAPVDKKAEPDKAAAGKPAAEPATTAAPAKKKPAAPIARTAPARPLVRPGLRRVRADGLARVAATAAGGAVDIRMGAATTVHIAKRAISMRVRLPGGAGGESAELVLRGRLIGDGASGALAIAFTAADVRRTSGAGTRRQAVSDLGGLRGTLRFEGDDLAVDLSGLDGVAGTSFGLPAAGARLSLRAAAGRKPPATGSAGRTATTLNLTSFDLGDQLEALRWIIEVDEPGRPTSRYEVGGVLDARTRSLHGLTVTEVGRRGGRRVDSGVLERTVLNSLRGRGDDLRIVGGIREAD